MRLVQACLRPLIIAFGALLLFLLISIAVVVANLGADLIYGHLDPRVRGDGGVTRHGAVNLPEPLGVVAIRLRTCREARDVGHCEKRKVRTMFRQPGPQGPGLRRRDE